MNAGDRHMLVSADNRDEIDAHRVKVVVDSSRKLGSAGWNSDVGEGDIGWR